MSRNRQRLGSWGEQLASAHLSAQGCQILYRNYRCRVGEIDLVIQEDQTIAVVEVRTRSSDRFGTPEESVNLRKQRQLQRVAAYLVQDRKWQDRPLRFDVVTVRARDGEPPIIHWIRDAW